MVEKQFEYRDWKIYYNPKPIPDNTHDYEAVHEDYDGPGDDRIFTAGSAKEIQFLIDDWHEAQ